MRIANTIVLTLLVAAGLACGYSSKSTPATAGTTPNISTLSPNNASHGSTGVVLTVNGTNFSTNATVNWNGTALTTTYISAQQMMTTIPNADLETAGTAAVTVTNPGTSGGQYGGGTLPETSNSMTFTIN